MAMFAAATLAGRAVRAVEPERAGSAAAAVLLCPVAVIEATVSAHNDALLAVATALLMVASIERRAVAGLLGGALGLAVKASAILIVGWTLVRRTAARGRLSVRGTLALPVLLFAGLWLAPRLLVGAGRFTGILKRDALECERALECVPRWLLWRSRHFDAAFIAGAAFRVAGATWLLASAIAGGVRRSARIEAPAMTAALSGSCRGGRRRRPANR
jgi:hypothetical protein